MNMKRRELACVLICIARGFWSRHRSIIGAIAAMALLPIEVSAAGQLSSLKGASKHLKAPKHLTSLSPRTVKLAVLGPVALPRPSLKPATACDPATFRIVLDVGHTADSQGAISARNVAEFAFNLRLAQRIEEKLKAEGFAETRLW